MYGLVLSLTIPVSFIMISEISPKDIRGRAQIFLHFFFLFGNLYLIWMMTIFMDNLVEGNWRAVALCAVIPCIIMIIGNIYYLEESPRYLIIDN